jgi:hypothetical protein
VTDAVEAAGQHVHQEHRGRCRRPARSCGRGDGGTHAHNTLSADNTDVQVLYPFYPQDRGRRFATDFALTSAHPTGTEITAVQYSDCTSEKPSSRGTD